MKEEAPVCECGCGQPVERSKVADRWNRYCHGHNSRSNSSSNNDNKFKVGNKFGKGRPQGSRNRVSINSINLIKGEEEALSRRAIEVALNGNTQMLQFCLSRILPPPLKDNVVKLEGMPECRDVESSVDLSSYLLKKLADGSLTPSQASLLSGIIEKHLKCLQINDLEKRLTDIEEKLDEKQ